MALDNFVLQNTNPLEAYLQGAGGIQTLQNNQQIMDARVAAQQQAVQQQQAAQAAAQAKQQLQLTMYNETDPLKHAKLVAQYQTAYPDDYKAVTDASKTMSDAQKTNLLGLSSKLANVSATGNYDLGQQILDQQVASMEGNVPDDQLAAAKTFQKRWAADPKGVVTGLSNAAYAIDPATFTANIKAGADTAAVVGKEGREQQLQPIVVQGKQADIASTQLTTQYNRQKMEYDKETEPTRKAQLLADLEKTQADIKKTQNQQLPEAALPLQEAHTSAISSLSGLNKDIASFQNQIKAGTLNFGKISNAWNSIKNGVGLSDTESTNFANYKNSMLNVVNESLRLNKGTQTEGDAQRATDLLLNNLGSQKIVQVQLAKLQALNNRQINTNIKQANTIRSNYGAKPLDYSDYTDQQSTIGGVAQNGRPSLDSIFGGK